MTIPVLRGSVRRLLAGALDGLATVAVTGSAGDLLETVTAKVMTGLERVKLAGVAAGATVNSSDAALRDRSTHTGSQNSGTISDFTEAAQDAVAAMLVSGANVSLSYNDAGNSLTITASGGDAELMRDTIGAALVGTAGVVVAVNDGADTITFSITGLTIAQTTGLQAALDAKETPAGAQGKVDAHDADSDAHETLFDGVLTSANAYADSAADTARDTARDEAFDAATAAVNGLLSSDYPNNDREINAGAGLSGGGSLAADRTLALDVASATFIEGAQDAVAAMLASGANVTLSYNDAGNSLQVTASGTDAEVVRDTIGAALVGTTGVAVAVNDGADTITFSITGLTIAQTTGLQTALDAKLAAASNLSDLADAGTARGNLGLGNSATRAVGTTTGTVAAGDDARLADARTPTAHATSHNIGGGDELTFPVRVLDKSIPSPIATQVVNTTTETTLFSLTIAAAKVVVGDLLVCEYDVDLLNNSGSAVVVTLKWKIGSTTVFTSAPSLTAAAQRHRHDGTLKIALASLTDLRCGLQNISPGPATAGTTNSGTIVVGQAAIGNAQVTAENLATDKTLVLTAQFATAAATIDARLLSAVLTRFR